MRLPVAVGDAETDGTVDVEPVGEMVTLRLPLQVSVLVALAESLVLREFVEVPVAVSEADALGVVEPVTLVLGDTVLVLDSVTLIVTLGDAEAVTVTVAVFVAVVETEGVVLDVGDGEGDTGVMVKEISVV